MVYFTYMSQKQRIVSAIALLAFAVLGRLLLLNLPNVETLTAASLIGAAYLGKRYAVVLPLLAVAMTDAIIGNTRILIFTWSAWAAIGLMGLVLRRWTESVSKFTAAATGVSMASTFFFFLWTNFGVWLMDGMYPPTRAGLLQSYVMGLPFLKFQILGSLMIVPIASYLASSIFARIHERAREKEEVWIKKEKPATTD